MRENRRFQRVNYLGTGWLHHNESKYGCRLENISNNGALVRLKKTPGVSINPGERCSLMLHLEDKAQRYQDFEAKIVRFESGMAALEFSESEVESLEVLDNLVKKELHFIDGGQKIIDLGLKVAEMKGIGLTGVHFDKGELNPEREMHTLRLSAGENSINVHLHRKEIEAFYLQNGSEETRVKVCHAINRLHAPG
jgi:hypothetical protein